MKEKLYASCIHSSRGSSKVKRMSVLGGWVKDALLALLVKVYLEGPWWMGCWGNMLEEDVCATLSASSQLTSTFWIQHRDECMAMIRDRVSSHSIGFCVLAVLANVVWLYLVMTGYCLFVRARRVPVELVYVSKKQPRLKSV